MNCRVFLAALFAIMLACSAESDGGAFQPTTGGTNGLDTPGGASGAGATGGTTPNGGSGGTTATGGTPQGPLADPLFSDPAVPTCEYGVGDQISVTGTLGGNTISWTRGLASDLEQGDFRELTVLNDAPVTLMQMLWEGPLEMGVAASVPRSTPTFEDACYRTSD